MAVASGKGGTGKTTLAVSLAVTAPYPAVYADCDVEAPDGALFLHPEIEDEVPFCQLLPHFDTEACDGCGVCHDVCEYKAILVAGKPLLFADRCHACGACALLCPQRAVDERPVQRGVIRRGRRGELLFLEGRLTIGEASPTALVRAVREMASADRRLVIIDAAPGTSCPVIAATYRADYLLLVTEPTPLGLHDLELAVELGRTLGVDMGIVVNRSGEADDAEIERFAVDRAVPILARIPFDRGVAAAYARGEIPVDAIPALRATVSQLWQAILDRAAS